MAAGPSSGTSSHEASSAGSVGIGTGPTSVVEVVDVAAGRGDDVVDAGGRVAGDAWSSLDAQATAPSATSSAAAAADARTDDRDPAMAHPRWRRYRDRSVRVRRPVSCRP